jgi:hypothetical protein
MNEITDRFSGTDFIHNRHPDTDSNQPLRSDLILATATYFALDAIYHQLSRSIIRKNI